MEVIFEIERDLRWGGIRSPSRKTVLKPALRTARQNARRVQGQRSGLDAVPDCVVGYVQLVAPGPFRVRDNALTKASGHIRAKLRAAAFAIEKKLRTEIVSDIRASFNKEAVSRVRSIEGRIEAGQIGIRVDGARRVKFGRERRGYSDFWPDTLSSEHQGSHPVLSQDGWIGRQRIDNSTRFEKIGRVVARGRRRS